MPGRSRRRRGAGYAGPAVTARDLVGDDHRLSRGVPGHLAADGRDPAGELVADRVGARKQVPLDHGRVEVAARHGQRFYERGMLVGELRVR